MSFPTLNNNNAGWIKTGYVYIMQYDSLNQTYTSNALNKDPFIGTLITIEQDEQKYTFKRIGNIIGNSDCSLSAQYGKKVFFGNSWSSYLDINVLLSYTNNMIKSILHYPNYLTYNGNTENNLEHYSTGSIYPFRSFL